MQSIWKRFGLALGVTLCIIFSPRLHDSDQISLSETPTTSWTYADLRLFDLPDNISPALDITALYLRVDGKTLQVRIDFLETTWDIEHDLYLAFDTLPGGETELPRLHDEQLIFPLSTDIHWNYLLKIAADGGHQLMRSDFTQVSGARLRSDRDPGLDILVVSLDSSRLSGSIQQLKVQAFITPRGANQVIDRTAIARLNAPPPPKLSILFATWNVFPAITPAQALRRWDGAHTGPLGERHGLRHLLSASRRSETPLLLLDILTPASLSALDYIEAASALTNLAEARLIFTTHTVLPALTGLHPPEAVEHLLKESRKTAGLFSIPMNSAVYTPAPLPLHYLPDEIRVMIFPDHSAEPVILPELMITRMGGRLLVQVPPALGEQAQRGGPAIDLRRALAQVTGNQLQNRSVYLLGGDLPQTLWGDPNAAYDTLAYLRARPWINFLSLTDLMHGMFSGNPVQPGIFEIPQPDVSTAHIPTSDLAWQTYQALNGIVAYTHPNLETLHSSFYWWIDVLNHVDLWAHAPGPSMMCEPNPGLPRHHLCYLASEQVYTIFDISAEGPSAGLMALFSRTVCSPKDTYCGYTQIVGPTFQLAAGLSDPTTWNFAAGLWSDPQSIPGAFGQPAVSDQLLELSWIENGLTIHGDVDLTVQLLPDGIRVSVRNPQGSSAHTPYHNQIPLILAPQTRFAPDWRQKYASTSGSGWLNWYIVGGPAVYIETNATIELFSFNDSPAPFTHPERPDLEYPPGHFYPFPLAVVELTSTSDFDLRIRIDQGASHE